MACAAAAQPDAPADAGVTFRGAAPVINGDGDPPPPADAGIVEESQHEVADLSDQKDTLESDLRYAQSKLDAARKRLDVESMAGHGEEADKWEQQVKDWQGRVDQIKSQLSEIDTQVQGEMQELQPPAPPQDLILPGDNLDIFVVEDTSYNGRFQVRRGGYIILPWAGRIPVAGKTLSEAEVEVRKALENSQLQHATVMVEKVEGPDITTGPVVFLAGEFKVPRPFTIPPGTKATIVNVILSCGGYTDKADLTRVKVMRIVGNKSVVEEENVQRILDGTGLSSDLTLNNGDVLLIPPGSNNFVFVTGRIVRQGSLLLRPGDKLTAYAAILEAGGFARFADLKKVYVLRATPDGTKVRIHVDIDAIQRGRAADIPLEGGDIIVVPEKFWSW